MSNAVDVFHELNRGQNERACLIKKLKNEKKEFCRKNPNCSTAIIDRDINQLISTYRHYHLAINQLKGKIWHNVELKSKTRPNFKYLCNIIQSILYKFENQTTS